MDPSTNKECGRRYWRWLRQRCCSTHRWSDLRPGQLWKKSTKEGRIIIIIIIRSQCTHSKRNNQRSSSDGREMRHSASHNHLTHILKLTDGVTLEGLVQPEAIHPQNKLQYNAHPQYHIQHCGQINHRNVAIDTIVKVHGGVLHNWECWKLKEKRNEVKQESLKWTWTSLINLAKDLSTAEITIIEKWTTQHTFYWCHAHNKSTRYHGQCFQTRPTHRVIGWMTAKVCVLLLII